MNRSADTQFSANEIIPGQKIRVEDYSFNLPPDRIAQEPAAHRDESRLMVLDRRRPGIQHLIFRDLPEILLPGDLLVLNDTRVINARLEGRKSSGGKVEFLFVEPDRNPQTWSASLPEGSQTVARDRDLFWKRGDWESDGLGGEHGPAYLSGRR